MSFYYYYFFYQCLIFGFTAYMAPEVITRNDKEGHGRAADIWSVGCVVIEMASGKVRMLAPRTSTN